MPTTNSPKRPGTELLRKITTELLRSRLDLRTLKQMFTTSDLTNFSHCICTVADHLLWPPCVADADIIFLPCGFFLSFFIPRLIWRSPAVEHWSLADVLSLFCARPVADGSPLMWVSHPL